MFNVKFEDKVSSTVLKGRYLKEENLFEVDLPTGTVRVPNSGGGYDSVDEIGKFASTRDSKMALGYTDEGGLNKWTHSILAVNHGENNNTYYIVEHEDLRKV